MSTPDLSTVFESIPLLRKLHPEDFEITRLPGYTNHNFRLRSWIQDWVLKIPRPETDSYIDRADEAHNQDLAAQIGLAPRALWRDERGMSLTRTLPGRSLRGTDLDDDRMLARIASSLARLHRSDLRFHGEVSLAELLERYFSLVPGEIQRDLMPRMNQAREKTEWLGQRKEALVASHNDLVLENWIVDGERTWMIDWEFSAMAPPYWDLAILCNSATLSQDRADKLLRAYGAGEVQMEEKVLSTYRFLLQLLSDCWMIALVPDTE